MSNHVHSYLDGKGIGRDMDRVKQALSTMDGRYAGYDVSRVSDDRVQFSSRNAVPLSACAHLSKGGSVILTYAGESDAYQIDRSIRFVDGLPNGRRQRFNDGCGHEDPWPEWTEIPRGEAMVGMESHKAAVAKSGGQAVQQRETIEVSAAGADERTLLK